VCGCLSPGIRVQVYGFQSSSVRLSKSGCASVRIRVCGCLSPGVRVSKSGCAGVRVRVCGCSSPGVWVSESGCAGVLVAAAKQACGIEQEAEAEASRRGTKNLPSSSIADDDSCLICYERCILFLNTLRNLLTSYRVLPALNEDVLTPQ
jgi:hypothetical protein